MLTLSGRRRRVLIEDPPIARFLFQSTVAAWGRLILRVWVGVQFLQAGRQSHARDAACKNVGAGSA